MTLDREKGGCKIAPGDGAPTRPLGRRRGGGTRDLPAATDPYFVTALFLTVWRGVAIRVQVATGGALVAVLN